MGKLEDRRTHGLYVETAVFGYHVVAFVSKSVTQQGPDVSLNILDFRSRIHFHPHFRPETVD